MGEVMPWGKPDLFIAAPLQPAQSGWGEWKAPVPVKPEWADDAEKKKLFGIELAKSNPSPFIAACKVFPEDTSGALWVSINWINDAEVIASRDLYLKTLALDTTLLDKTQFASTLLKISVEADMDGKDRIAALNLYAKVMGFVDDSAVKVNNSFTHNEMKVTFVRTEKKEENVVVNNDNSEILNQAIPLPLKLKLV